MNLGINSIRYYTSLSIKLQLMKYISNNNNNNIFVLMNKRNIVFLVFVLISSFGLWISSQNEADMNIAKRILLSTYNTNPVRTNSVVKFCAGLDRNNLVDLTDVSTADGYKSQLAAQFSISGNDLINKLISGNSSGSITDVQTQTQAYGMFAGAFVIGLVILLFMWSFLMCCCCCPGCCPSKCCQKADNQQYTKCELYWPTIFLILCLLLIIATSAIGISKAGTFKKGLDATTCSTSIFMDDLINGNVTADGTKFFMGLSTLSTQLGNLNTNVADIQSNISTLATSDTTMTGYLNDATNAKQDSQKIPTNALTSAAATIQYTTPFDDTYSGGNPTIDSIVVQFVGSSSNISSMSGSLYDISDKLYTALNSIATNSQTVKNNIAGFAGNITSIQTTINDFKNKISDYSDQSDTYLSKVQTPSDMGTLVMQVFYGASLGLALLSLIGVVLMTFCDKYKCRYLMYFSCMFMFFIALIGFLLAIIFSLIIPMYYWGCEWISTTVGSQAGFTANVNDLITDAKIRSYVQSCVSGGTGDLVTAIGTATGIDVTSLNSLSDSVTQANSFNTTAYTNELTAAMNGVQTKIDDFQSGKTPDITDSSSINILKYASQPTNFNSSCASSIMLDSWLYTNLNTSFINCKVSGGHTVVSTDCDLAAVQTAPAGNCQGCMDSHVIFNDIYSGSARGSVATDLGTRYTACASTTFPTYMGNVWDNYYFVKIPIMQGIQTRTTTALASINIVIADLVNINTLFNNVITTLDATVSGVIDPQYGLVAGLNCLLIGEDIKTFVSTFCVSNFNTVYLTRLVMGISSFGILFSLCCIVCSGVRHFKHSQRKVKIAPSFGGKNSFEETQAVFRN